MSSSLARLSSLFVVFPFHISHMNDEEVANANSDDTVVSVEPKEVQRYMLHRAYTHTRVLRSVSFALCDAD